VRAQSPPVERPAQGFSAVRTTPGPRFKWIPVTGHECKCEVTEAIEIETASAPRSSGADLRLS
jgi:hypothetical protein